MQFNCESKSLDCIVVVEVVVVVGGGGGGGGGGGSRPSREMMISALLTSLPLFHTVF